MAPHTANRQTRAHGLYAPTGIYSLRESIWTFDGCKRQEIKDPLHQNSQWTQAHLKGGCCTDPDSAKAVAVESLLKKTFNSSNKLKLSLCNSPVVWRCSACSQYFRPRWKCGVPSLNKLLWMFAPFRCQIMAYMHFSWLGKVTSPHLEAKMAVSLLNYSQQCQWPLASMNIWTSADAQCINPTKNVMTSEAAGVLA